MDSLKVLIAMNNSNLTDKIKGILQEQGYNIADTAQDGHECLRKARAFRIDIAIIDFDLPIINGMNISKILTDDNICDIILISSEHQRGLIGDIQNRNDISVLTKPLNKAIFLNTLEIMSKSHKRAEALKVQVEELKETIETRKLVEKAKGILMKKLKITEDEAFRLIQKRSMDERKSIKEVAEGILDMVKYL